MDSVMQQLADLGRMIRNTAADFAFKDILDIAIVALLIYGAINLLRETRAGQLVKGLIFLIVLNWLSGPKLLNMVMTNKILTYVFAISAAALIILFQPEIRKALEQMGRGNLGKSVMNIVSGKDREKEDTAAVKVIDSVVEACGTLQQMRMGALVVFERNTKLNEVVETGTIVNAEPTPQLIGNIFFNKAPLHDGAMIIRSGRVLAAGCVLPLTARDNVNASLGTRHRAALGISEDTDAVAVVVSEETGQISIAKNGNLTRNFNRLTLKEVLTEMLLNHPENEAIQGSKKLLHKMGIGSKRKGAKKDE